MPRSLIAYNRSGDVVTGAKPTSWKPRSFFKCRKIFTTSVTPLVSVTRAVIGRVRWFWIKARTLGAVHFVSRNPAVMIEIKRQKAIRDRVRKLAVTLT